MKRRLRIWLGISKHAIAIKMLQDENHELVRRLGEVERTVEMMREQGQRGPAHQPAMPRRARTATEFRRMVEDDKEKGN